MNNIHVPLAITENKSMRGVRWVNEYTSERKRIWEDIYINEIDTEEELKGIVDAINYENITKETLYELSAIRNSKKYKNLRVPYKKINKLTGEIKYVPNVVFGRLKPVKKSCTIGTGYYENFVITNQDRKDHPGVEDEKLFASIEEKIIRDFGGNYKLTVAITRGDFLLFAGDMKIDDIISQTSESISILKELEKIKSIIDYASKAEGEINMKRDLVNTIFDEVRILNEIHEEVMGTAHSKTLSETEKVEEEMKEDKIVDEVPVEEPVVEKEEIEKVEEAVKEAPVEETEKVGEETDFITGDPFLDDFVSASATKLKRKPKYDGSKKFKKHGANTGDKGLDEFVNFGNIHRDKRDLYNKTKETPNRETPNTANSDSLINIENTSGAEFQLRLVKMMIEKHAGELIDETLDSISVAYSLPIVKEELLTSDGEYSIENIDKLIASIGGDK